MTQISALTANPSPALTDKVGIDTSGNVSYRETANDIWNLLTSLGAITSLADGDQFVFADASDSNNAVKITWANVVAALAAASTTFTNKRITKRVTTIASSATPTPDADAADMYVITALAAAAEFGAPTGTPTQGQTLLIRVKDNGTGRALTYNAIYRTLVTPATTTVAGKTLYLGFVYNSTDTKWDCVLSLNEP